MDIPWPVGFYTECRAYHVWLVKGYVCMLKGYSLPHKSILWPVKNVPESTSGSVTLCNLKLTYLNKQLRYHHPTN